MDPILEARYRSPGGAAAYRHKYERSLARRLSNRRELAMVRAALARAGTKGRVLDCPTGAGRLVPTLLAVADHVTGADMSPAMIVEATEALAPALEAGRLDLLVASSDALPFEDDAFDTAVCHRLLHHMPDAEERGATLRELARVAARRVICSFSDDTTPKARRQRRRGVHRRRHPLQPEVFLAEARAAGLSPIGAPLHLAPWFSLVSVVVFAVEGAAP
jgi:ubiquinone/menaquinone biosynthesis C-methylase UbiE